MSAPDTSLESILTEKDFTLSAGQRLTLQVTGTWVRLPWVDGDLMVKVGDKLEEISFPRGRRITLVGGDYFTKITLRNPGTDPVSGVINVGTAEVEDELVTIAGFDATVVDKPLPVTILAAGADPAAASPVIIQASQASPALRVVNKPTILRWLGAANGTAIGAGDYTSMSPGVNAGEVFVGYQVTNRHATSVVEIYDDFVTEGGSYGNRAVTIFPKTSVFIPHAHSAWIHFPAGGFDADWAQVILPAS
jgi:hypothetical protein